MRDHGAAPRGQSAVHEFVELTRSPNLGVYQPAEVEDDLEEVLQSVGQMRDIIFEGGKISSRVERREYLASIIPIYEANLKRSRRMFRRWQDRIRADGERLLHSLEQPNVRVRVEDEAEPEEEARQIEDDGGRGASSSRSV